MSIKGFNIKGNIEKIDYDSLENKPFGIEPATSFPREVIPLQEIELSQSEGSNEVLSTYCQLHSPIGLNRIYEVAFDENHWQVVEKIS